MKTLFLALAMAVAAGDDTYTVTLTLQSMHCPACKTAIEDRVKGINGYKSHEISEENKTISITFLEKNGVRYSTFAKVVPTDMKLEKAAITVRGWASSTGNYVGLEAKDSKEKHQLVDRDPKKDTKVAELQKALGTAKKKYKVSGELAIRDKVEVLILESFEAAEWKDE